VADDKKKYGRAESSDKQKMSNQTRRRKSKADQTATPWKTPPVPVSDAATRCLMLFRRNQS